jgi:hypothetical protein
MAERVADAIEEIARPNRDDQPEKPQIQADPAHRRPRLLRNTPAAVVALVVLAVALAGGWATFSDQNTSFDDASFTAETVLFDGAKFASAATTFTSAKFKCLRASFDSPADWRNVEFDWDNAPAGSPQGVPRCISPRPWPPNLVTAEA